MSNFNLQLRVLRTEANLSQNELAQKIGISKSRINMYERGDREPGLEMLETFADFFNVDMNYLLGYQSQKHVKNTAKAVQPSAAAVGDATASLSQPVLSKREIELIEAYRHNEVVSATIDSLLSDTIGNDESSACHHKPAHPVVELPLDFNLLEPPILKLADDSNPFDPSGDDSAPANTNE